MEYEVGPDELVSMAVVRAVSTVRDCEPCALTPLATVIDPDALDSLFGPQHNGLPRNGGRLSFIYSNCRVTINHNEYIHIEPVGLNHLGTEEPTKHRL